MLKFSSTPRPIRVIAKADPDTVYEFESVSKASRLTGVGREHIQGILSGRCGKRHQFTFEYI